MYWNFLDLRCWRVFYCSRAWLNTLFVLKTGIGHGVKKGYLAATGVFIGDAVLMFLAWAGVAALIQTTPVLFNIVRYLGALYLLWLGGKMLWSVIMRKNSACRQEGRAGKYDPEALAGIEFDQSQGDSVLRLIFRAIH